MSDDHTTAADAADAGLREHIQRRELVQHTVQSGLCRAKTLYDESAPAFLKSSVERTSWLSEPLVSRLSAMAPPVIRCLDNGLGAAYTKLGGTAAASTADAGNAGAGQREGEPLLVDDSWFAQVDDLLHQRREDVHRFYGKAADAFAGLQSVTYGDFSDRLRQLLPDLEDRYLAPSKAFFVAAQARWREQPNVDVRELAGALRERFERVWEDRLVVNGRAVYDEAIRHYAAVADRNPSVAQLVDGMQARLGGVWESRLAALLHDLFSRAKELPASTFRAAAEAAAARAEPIKAAAAGPHARAEAALAAAVDALRARWAAALDLSERAVDAVLPELPVEGAPTAGAGEADEAPPTPPTPSREEGRPEGPSLGAVARTVTRRVRARATRLPRAVADATGVTAAAARARQWPRERVADLRRRLADVAAHARDAATTAERSVRTRRPARLPFDLVLLARQLGGLDERHASLDEFLGHAKAAAWSAAGVWTLAWVWAPAAQPVDGPGEAEQVEGALADAAEGEAAGEPQDEQEPAPAADEPEEAPAPAAATVHRRKRGGGKNGRRKRQASAGSGTVADI